jgi:hypothetical protein
MHALLLGLDMSTKPSGPVSGVYGRESSFAPNSNCWLCLLRKYIMTTAARQCKPPWTARKGVVRPLLAAILMVSAVLAHDDDPNHGVVFIYPTEKQTYNTKDTVNVTYTSPFPTPNLFLWCDGGGAGKYRESKIDRCLILMPATADHRRSLQKAGPWLQRHVSHHVRF